MRSFSFRDQCPQVSAAKRNMTVATPTDSTPQPTPPSTPTSPAETPARESTSIGFFGNSEAEEAPAPSTRSLLQADEELVANMPKEV